MPRNVPATRPHLLLPVLLTFAACDPVEKLIGSDPPPPSAPPVTEAKLTDPPNVPEDTWLEFTSEEGRFEARLPGAPEKQLQQTPTAAGPMDMVMQSVQAGSAFFAIAYSDMSAEAIPGFNLDAGLDGARNGAINNVGGTLVSEQQIQFAGHPARAFTAKASVEGHELTVEARIFFVLPRFYQLMVVYPASETTVPVQRFFDGFSLLSNPPG